jgi:O-antigen/teichoic acid export membrane protein
VNSAVSLVAFAYIARAITRYEMGSLAVLMLVAGGVQVLTDLGVGLAATQFVATYEAKKEYKNMRAAGYTYLIINALMTAIVVIAIIVSADSISKFMLGAASRANLFRLVTWEIAAISVNGAFNSILTGLKRFREISIASMSSFAVRQSSVVILLAMGLGLPGILIGWAIGDSLNSLLLGALTRKHLGQFELGFGFTRLLRFSAPLFTAQVANYAWAWFDRALLLPFVTLAQLGAYNVAVVAYGILNGVPSSMASTLFPYYSHFYKGGTAASGKQDLENALKTASRYVSLLTIPLSLGLAATAVPAATLLAGTNYFDAAYPLAMLAVFLAVSCWLGAISQIFVVLERPTASALVTIGSVLLSVLIGLVAIPHFGILGASLARGFSLLFSLALSIFILRIVFKPKFDTAAFRQAWVAGICMVAVVLALEWIIYSKYLLVLYVVVGGIVYIVLLRAQKAISIDDMELLSGFLSPRFRFIMIWAEKALGVSAHSNH